MTAIVWDGQELAADRQTTWGDLGFITTKIRRLPDGTLIAISGIVTLAEEMVAYLTTPAGENRPKWPEKSEDHAQVIIVKPDGQVAWYIQDRPFPMSVQQKLMAWGSAREIAMGALFAGADARRAVEICIELSPGCGHGIQVERPGAVLRGDTWPTATSPADQST